MPHPLWEPGPDRIRDSRIRAFIESQGFDQYRPAWEWSVAPTSVGDFWEAVAREFAVPWRSRAHTAIRDAPDHPTGVVWFPGSTLNYAEMALRPPTAGSGGTAVVSRSQTRADQEISWEELRGQVGAVRAALADLGVGAGDRVAGYLPNISETLMAMLATASLGAIWTCCAPEMGVAGVIDRLSQVEPKVLIAVDGYRYGDRAIDRVAECEAIRQALPSVRQAVLLPYLHSDRRPPEGWTDWADLRSGGPVEPEFEPVAFDHPLYVLFSSGTTGKPKPIIHGHGGITIEHAKALGLYFDIGPRDRFFWYTTTGWMMWNFCISALLVDATVVLFDGNPSWPDPESLWALMAETSTTCGGVGSGFLAAAAKRGDRPGHDHDLTALRTLGATGSPLPGAAAEWVYQEVAPDILLSSFSGGTDVCTGFVSGSPLHPVWPGEISAACLGAAVRVFDDTGRPVVGEEGELVISRPLPSMPVGFWNDADQRRYRDAYFDRFPGVWAHGDRATETERHSFVITGRSDGTLNRGGVRMGTAEFYGVIESMPEVADSLVVHLDDPEGGPGELWLFVATDADEPEQADLASRIRSTLRKDLSPRHVPDRVEFVAAIPRTLSGKKLEVPVKRILAGRPVEQALTIASVANPESLEPFVRLAAERS